MWQLQKPVAFFVFNRPETTAIVFEEIRKARPPRLMVVADGPRPNRIGEAEKCKAVREMIERVDWPCEVQKNYSDSNMGCKLRMSSGLDWVFDTVEDAIILEDDCLPHHSFFRFCEELLDRYIDDSRIFMISGFNNRPVSGSSGPSYLFSRYPHIWGWASWRRVWQSYDVTMRRWPELRESGQYRHFCGSLLEAVYWKRWFDSIYKGKVDTWDAQMTFASFYQNGLTVFPVNNLITNIGFGPEATHTIGERSPDSVATGLLFPLRHPEHVVSDVEWDKARRRAEYSFTSKVRNIVRHH